MPSKLYVGNLAYSVSNEDLQDLFSQVGQVQSATVITDKFSGQSKGFGFVVPDSPTDHGDLFIPPPATGGAITGDTVAARITRRAPGGSRPIRACKMASTVSGASSPRPSATARPVSSQAMALQAVVLQSMPMTKGLGDIALS